MAYARAGPPSRVFRGVGLLQSIGDAHATAWPRSQQLPQESRNTRLREAAARPCDRRVVAEVRPRGTAHSADGSASSGTVIRAVQDPRGCRPRSIGIDAPRCEADEQRPASSPGSRVLRRRSRPLPSLPRNAGGARADRVCAHPARRRRRTPSAASSPSRRAIPVPVEARSGRSWPGRCADERQYRRTAALSEQLLELCAVVRFGCPRAVPARSAARSAGRTRTRATSSPSTSAVYRDDVAVRLGRGLCDEQRPKSASDVVLLPVRTRSIVTARSPTARGHARVERLDEGVAASACCTAFVASGPNTGQRQQVEHVVPSTPSWSCAEARSCADRRSVRFFPSRL